MTLHLASPINFNITNDKNFVPENKATLNYYIDTPEVLHSINSHLVRTSLNYILNNIDRRFMDELPLYELPMNSRGLTAYEKDTLLNKGLNLVYYSKPLNTVVVQGNYLANNVSLIDVSACATIMLNLSYSRKWVSKLDVTKNLHKDKLLYEFRMLINEMVNTRLICQDEFHIEITNVLATNVFTVQFIFLPSMLSQPVKFEILFNGHNFDFLRYTKYKEEISNLYDLHILKYSERPYFDFVTNNGVTTNIEIFNG